MQLQRLRNLEHLAIYYEYKQGWTLVKIYSSWWGVIGLKSSNVICKRADLRETKNWLKFFKAYEVNVEYCDLDLSLIQIQILIQITCKHLWDVQ